MLQFIVLCIKNFGFLSGISVYIQIKITKSGRIYLPGLKHPVYLRPDTSDVHTFREIFLRQEYDISFSGTPQVIIDAGANIGFTTLFFTKRYPTAKIFSLEPDSENFKILKNNTRVYKNITSIQAALWNKKGTIEIKDKGYGVRGFMAEEGAAGSITSLPSTTMDDLMQEHTISSIDILKIDIEGSENEVFSSGAEKWLPVTKCLIIELHDRMKPGCSKAVFKALSVYNFEMEIKGENLVFVNKDY